MKEVSMVVLYKKPEIMCYSAVDIIEELGPCQNAYTTVILYTTTGNTTCNADGFVVSNGEVDTVDQLIAGDNAANDYARTLVGFDIRGIHSTVVSATLKVYQYEITGTPYADLGNLVADHVNFGSSIDLTDLTGGTLTSNIGEISTSTALGWKTLDVTTYVQQDLDSGRTSSQFRLRFTTNTESGGDNDFIYNESAENTGLTNNHPELVVTYK